MPDTDVTTPIDVAKGALALRAKAQLRIALASIAGVAAYWQDFRTVFTRSRLWRLAISKAVPDSLVRPAGAERCSASRST